MAADAARVRVTARRTGAVRLKVTSGKKAVASKRVRVRAGKTATVRLRLSKAGRRVLGSCAKQRITVRATSAKARAFVRSTFQRDPKRCPGTHDAAPTVVGSSQGSGLAGTGSGGRRNCLHSDVLRSRLCRAGGQR